MASGLLPQGMQSLWQAPRMEIGHRIKRARTDAGLSQTELAKAVQVSRGLVGQWESHVKKPGRENLEKIAAATCVSVASLLSDTPDPSQGVWVSHPDELKMLRAFRRMSDRQRKNAIELFSVSGDIIRELEHQGSPAKGKKPV